MSDDRFRNAERAWRATGSPEDAQRLDREARRAGRISEPRRGLMLRLARAMRERLLDLLTQRAAAELEQPVHLTILRRDVMMGLVALEHQQVATESMEDMVVYYAVGRYLRRMEPIPFQPIPIPGRPQFNGLNDYMNRMNRALVRALTIPPELFQGADSDARDDASVAMSLALCRARGRKTFRYE